VGEGATDGVEGRPGAREARTPLTPPVEARLLAAEAPLAPPGALVLRSGGPRGDPEGGLEQGDSAGPGRF
jgi:hypothetical protein